MRLDFNVILVDDDWDDEDNNSDLKNLIHELEQKILSKGFQPNIKPFASITEANLNDNRRTDLFLSDNNLGDNSNHPDLSAKNGGIEYYLELKQKPFLCDFVLYTRTQKNEIIQKLATDLTTRQDPNLFSRFTFVTRSNGGTGWHRLILDTIDHTLTKREELNNLRGFYAQQTSRMDEHLKSKYPSTKEKKFKATINFIPNTAIDSHGKQKLHEVREIRNGLMHNDEVLCTINDEYLVRFQSDDQIKHYEIYESQLQIYREKLNNANDLVMAL